MKWVNRTSWCWLALGVLSSSFLGTSCAGAKGAAGPSDPSQADSKLAPVVGNPFDGAVLFNPPYTNADQTRRRLERENSPDAPLIAKIADTPQARWFGGWSGDVKTSAGNYVRAANKQNKVPLLVAYNIPNRDCGQYSAGGASDPQQYKTWIASLAEGIGDNQRAIVVLEPDALGHLEDCLSEADQAQRLELIKYAVETLEALPGVAVYIDAGHARWMQPEQAAERLGLAGVDKARGFALNVSNYIGDEELIPYGEKISGLLGGSHFIIDSSRNGNGPTEDAQWCNPAGRALGRPPTTDTGNPQLDAFVWIKNPGESDGTCQGGPEAGQWFHERAVEMARNAKW